ncbi:ABC transporter permease [Natronosalvus vescus]|uniref:ABC transporter permease n=1 Tax=Natronosalvus vescus TaxID=2953881 RepID=UPI0020908122|nr:ABC transporter permease [Natronosalvus vescus]
MPVPDEPSGVDGHPLESTDWARNQGSIGWDWFDVLRWGILAAVIVAAISDTVLVDEWNVLPVSMDVFDWLLVIALTVALVVSAPVLCNRDRLRWHLSRYPTDLPSVFGLVVVGLVFLVGFLGPFFVPEPTEAFDRLNQPPLLLSVDESLVSSCLGEQRGGVCHGTMDHPFGTDRWGMDVLTYVVYSTRTTLEMIVLVAMIAVPIATLVGTAAAYGGGWIDSVLMRYVDVQMVVPAFFIYFVLYFTYGPSHTMLIAVFGLFSWGGIARAVRLEVLRVRQEAYVSAAKAAGASTRARILDHVFPNVTGVIVVSMTIQIPFLIVAEASLSFLGLGDAYVYSWGDIIRRGLEDIHLRAWIPAIPGIALTVTVLGCYLLGDALQQMFDPRTR